LAGPVEVTELVGALHALKVSAAGVDSLTGQLQETGLGEGAETPFVPTVAALEEEAEAPFAVRHGDAATAKVEVAKKVSDGLTVLRCRNN
jgi:hypothetical protein